MATWTHVQTVAEAGTVLDPTHETVAFGSNVTAGSLLIVGQYGSAAPGAVPTDTRGNTYTQIGTTLTTGNGQRLAWWYAINAGSGANTVDFPVMGTFDAAFVSEFTVDGGTISLDDSDQNTFSVDDPSTPTMTASVTDTLVVSAIGSDQGAGVSYTAGANFTVRGSSALQGSANDTFAFESRQLASAGSVSGTWVTSAADTGGVVGAVFKTTGAAADPPKLRVLQSNLRW